MRTTSNKSRERGTRTALAAWSPAVSHRVAASTPTVATPSPCCCSGERGVPGCGEGPGQKGAGGAE